MPKYSATPASYDPEKSSTTEPFSIADFASIVSLEQPFQTLEGELKDLEDELKDLEDELVEQEAQRTDNGDVAEEDKEAIKSDDKVEDKIIRKNKEITHKKVKVEQHLLKPPEEQTQINDHSKAKQILNRLMLSSTKNSAFDPIFPKEITTIIKNVTDYNNIKNHSGNTKKIEESRRKYQHTEDPDLYNDATQEALLSWYDQNYNNPTTTPDISITEDDKSSQLRFNAIKQKAIDWNNEWSPEKYLFEQDRKSNVVNFRKNDDSNTILFKAILIPKWTEGVPGLSNLSFSKSKSTGYNIQTNLPELQEEAMKALIGAFKISNPGKPIYARLSEFKVGAITELTILDGKLNLSELLVTYGLDKADFDAELTQLNLLVKYHAEDADPHQKLGNIEEVKKKIDMLTNLDNSNNQQSTQNDNHTTPQDIQPPQSEVIDTTPQPTSPKADPELVLLGQEEYNRGILEDDFNNEIKLQNQDELKLNKENKL
jgi:hypothetical protein